MTKTVPPYITYIYSIVVITNLNSGLIKIHTGEKLFIKIHTGEKLFKKCTLEKDHLKNSHWRKAIKSFTYFFIWLNLL